MRRDVDHNGSLEEYFYHADDQFNIVAVTNASGTVVERYEYGPFGAPTILDPGGAVRTESAIGNANLWNGREYDAETGLYYYRLRYLDPELGRFTTLDPIGLWGDPNNLGNGYAYVGNRPWTGLDPFGLDVLEDFAPNANLGGSGVHGSSYLSRAADLGLRASGQSASNAIDAAIVAQPYIAAGGSVLEIVGGIGVATSGLPTGVGAVGGGFIIGHGIDSLQANIREIIYGQPVRTFTAQGATYLTGSEAFGDYFDLTVGFADLGVGSVGVLARSGRLTRPLSTVSCTAGPTEQAFALGSKLPDGSIARARSVGAMAFDPLEGLGKLTNKESSVRSALGLTKQQFNDAVHRLKRQIPGNPDITFGIEEGVNFGNVYDRRSGEHIGNLFDEIY
jgi:RHS repeat-associated protein